MKILICNAGSTSLKFKLFEMPQETLFVQAGMERVGSGRAGIFEYAGRSKVRDCTETVIPNYEEGIRLFLSKALEEGDLTALSELAAVGFKTVLSKDHYGTHLVDESVLQGMKDYMSVAPAHNKHYLEAIQTFQKILPGVALVGAFETDFHRTMKPEAYIYSAPYEWYEKYGVRRFGYHGASHAYVASCLTEELGDTYKAVSCHLGGSCSLCAIENGKSVDTSFGMSLQTGLPQNNRCGDLDPFVIDYLMKECGLSEEQIFEDLQKKSGLLGISGISNDMRDLFSAEEKEPRAKLAIAVFCRELTRYIAGYAGIMGGLDAIAFTGGIGEKSGEIRARVLDKLSFLGITVNDNTFTGGVKRISTEDSKVAVFVITANEELGVARRVYDVLK